MSYITINARLGGAPERFEILRDAMASATKVYKGVLWNLRDEYEREGKANCSAGNLNRIARSLPRHKELYSDIVDTTRMEVGWAYSSFFALAKNDTSARPPGFRKKTVLSPLPDYGKRRSSTRRG